MSNFFKYFPTTKYRDAIVKNITRRVKILDEVQNDPFSFLPYTVMDDDSPEMVAYYYYGAAEYSWVVFLSNNIIDPYSQWPMSNENFEKTLARNYEKEARVAISGPYAPQDYLSDRQIVEWSMNTSRTDNIVHYKFTGYDFDTVESISPFMPIISRDTYEYTLSVPQRAEYGAVRVYDYENEKNESYRNIRLLNVDYLDTAVRNLEKEVNG